MGGCESYPTLAMGSSEQTGVVQFPAVVSQTVLSLLCSGELAGRREPVLAPRDPSNARETDMRFRGRMQAEASPAIFHWHLVPVVGKAKQRQLSRMALVCNPCTLEAEAGRLSCF